MRIFKRIVLGLLVALLVISIGFVAWAETPLGPASQAVDALRSDGTVRVTTGRFVAFEPVNAEPTIGFIFYPGGHVDYRSYAEPLRAIAERGYLVVLVPVRFNLAFFDINAADPIFAQYPGIQHWAAGGHSLGGVAAALFAKDHPQLEGLAFWASYPADDSLSKSNLKMLSVYGTLDMGGVAKFDETRPLLVADAQYVVIEGGNHGQFGDYGPQPGDQAATISRADQQAQVVQATAAFLKELGQ